MPYDRELADRLRAVLGGWDETHDDEIGLVDEKPMFGGLGFMVAGHLAVCAGSDGDLMVRVRREDLDEVCTAEGVEPMTMGARSMRTWVHVDPAVLHDEQSLTAWVDRGVAAARLA